MEQIIGFFGGDSQTGTTMTAWSFAEGLAEGGHRVLLLFGSGEDDTAVIPADGSSSIDDIRAALRSGHLEQEDLFQCLTKKQNLWLLPGTKNSMMSAYFLENTFQVMLEAMEDAFDYVVIDGGSDLRQGLTVSALNVCTIRYFVLTQQLKTVHRYMRKKQLYCEAGINGQIIINQYRKDPALLLKKDICQIIGVEDAMVIPYIEEGWQAEIEKRNLLQFSKSAKAMKQILLPYGKGVSGEKKVKRWKKRG